MNRRFPANKAKSSRQFRRNTARTKAINIAPRPTRGGGRSETMACNYPGTGRQSPTGTVTYYGHLQKAAGRIPPAPPNYKDFPLPCGKCTGCKLERSRQWAVRLMHEAQLHERTSFITLTYRDEDLPNSPARVRKASPRRARRPGSGASLDRRARAETHTHEIQEAPSLSKGDLNRFTRALNEDVRRRFGKG